MSCSRVAVVRCEDYDKDNVSRAVKRGIDLLGGVDSFARCSDRLVLKPNVLVGDPPEACTTTHPEVFSAVAEAFRSVTAHIGYGDSPGLGKSETQLRKAGFQRQAEKLGIRLADFEQGQEVGLGTPGSVERVTIAKGILSADGVVSISKLKTHQLTRITGAVKNQFGCIPGKRKAELHNRLPDVNEFSRMLVGLNLLVRPRLCVMDGIMAMEGNGPRSGNPIRMNVLLFSRDPVALDAVVCRLINLDPEFVPTMKPGHDCGLGTYYAEDIEMVGDPLDSLSREDFDVVRRPPMPATRDGSIGFFKNLFLARPIINEEACVRCGVCVQVCPVRPRAVNWVRASHARPPVHDYKRCIRCFCCQEMCPEKAISVRTPLLGTISGRR